MVGNFISNFDFLYEVNEMRLISKVSSEYRLQWFTVATTFKVPSMAEAKEI